MDVVIVFVETNFLMAVAMGREAHGDDLISAASDWLRVLIPTGCYMEAFSALEAEQKRRKRFQTELDVQIGQLRRDNTSENAGSLLRSLEESRIANDRLLNDVQARLFELIGRAAGVFGQIPATPEILHAAVGALPMLIAEPTDNLILHSIIDHCKGLPDARKALLTGNTNDFSTQEVRAALAEAGIAGPFQSVESVLGWAGLLPR